MTALIKATLLALPAILAVCVAKLTLACVTPATLYSAFSTDAKHPAQRIPSISRSLGLWFSLGTVECGGVCSFYDFTAEIDLLLHWFRQTVAGK